MTSAPLLFAKNLQWSQELCTLQGWWLDVEPSTDPSQSCPESHGPATPSPFLGLAFFCQDPQNGGKASVASSWGAQCGLQAPGVPLGRLVDLVPPAVGQLSLGDCRVSLLSVVMGHPSYLGAMGSLLVLHAPALDGETLLLHWHCSLDTGNRLNTNGKGNRAKQRKKNRELLGCFRSHLWLRVCTACTWTWVPTPANYQVPGPDFRPPASLRSHWQIQFMCI